MPPVVGFNIPSNIREQILPKLNLLILELLNLDLPTVKPTLFTHPNQYFAPDEPNTTDPKEIHSLLTPLSFVVKENFFFFLNQQFIMQCSDAVHGYIIQIVLPSKGGVQHIRVAYQISAEWPVRKAKGDSP